MKSRLQNWLAPALRFLKSGARAAPTVTEIKPRPGMDGHGGEQEALPPRTKLTGRAFYESIGSPKMVLAPMVDQSEFAWRMLTRSFLPKLSPDSRSSLLAYTPMIHARLFAAAAKVREGSFQPTRAPSSEKRPPTSSEPHRDLYLDGNPAYDRPLFVQFCANDPEELLSAARYVEPYCDAVDLNLGCPQGIAKKGNYGAFLQEDWDLIYRLINRLHTGLAVPVTAKIRILETREKTLDYAKMVLSAGASILTVHGRQRDQKGHNTGLADWSVLRYLRDNLPLETVIFANGNILRYPDIEACLAATGADGVMSAEGNLADPTIFAEPPAPGAEGREYFRGRDERSSGWRMDAIMRRYLDIIYTHVLETPPPDRPPLFLPTDPVEVAGQEANGGSDQESDEQRLPSKKRKREARKNRSPNLSGMQAHLFNLLRPLVTKRTDVRDALARLRGWNDMSAFEHVLQLVEKATKHGMLEYASQEGTPDQSREPQQSSEYPLDNAGPDPLEENTQSIADLVRRPYFVCQPRVRTLPAEAMAKGALTLSKKERQRLEAEEKEERREDNVAKEIGLEPAGTTETQKIGRDHDHNKPVGEDTRRRRLSPGQPSSDTASKADDEATVEIPREGLVCG